MLKKDIKYEDYNGTTRTDTFYFNISEAKLMDMDMEMDHEEGFEAYMTKVVNAANNILYGESGDARLPLPSEVFALLGYTGTSNSSGGSGSGSGSGSGGTSTP